jgi:hypothetical protein
VDKISSSSFLSMIGEPMFICHWTFSSWSWVSRRSRSASFCLTYPKRVYLPTILTPQLGHFLSMQGTPFWCGNSRPQLGQTHTEAPPVCLLDPPTP